MGWIYVEDEPQINENELPMDVHAKPKVRLVGTDGNAFAIMGAVKKAMKEFQKVNPDYAAPLMFKEYQEAATAGDYDNLLRVTMGYCDVY